MQALEIDGTLPLPLFGQAQIMAHQAAGGVDKALANLEKALDKVVSNPFICTLGSMMSAGKMVEVPFLLVELEVTSKTRQMSVLCSC